MLIENAVDLIRTWIGLLQNALHLPKYLVTEDKIVDNWEFSLIYVMITWEMHSILSTLMLMQIP